MVEKEEKEIKEKVDEAEYMELETYKGEFIADVELTPA